MTITAEPLTSGAGVSVTLETEVAAVIVPESVTVQLSGPTAVNARIGAPNSIAVAMTTAPGAGGITGIVAGLTVFDILARRFAVSRPPVRQRVLERHAQLRNVAIVAESPAVVTGEAVRQRRFGL